ncbi:nitrous oxide reductase family maturation protein NosD [Candidatus Gracilibacteria bacterium]|nr:nitrous oxide reductase family maturation protein NosD [Candidatus Gracilibacteria bacterium]
MDNRSLADAARPAWRGAHGASSGTLLTVAAPGVRISGLTVQNSGRSLLNDDAAILVVADDVTIEHNRLHDIHHAVYIKDGAARSIVRNNTIVGRVDLIREDRGNGIHLWDAPDALVELNTVLHVRDGVYVGFAPRSIFRDNVFREVRYGIHFMYADDNLFEHNRFEYAEAGAALMYSKNITLRGNVFAHSRSSRAYGLLLQECDGVLAEDNLLLNNSRGLFVNVSRDGVFRRNRFVANDLAVQIYAGAERNQFTSNDFVANLQLVMLDAPGSNVWRGNYWDEYRGLDMDGDGAGDSAFSTGDPLGSLLSDYPQLRLFSFSPAVQALAAAERAFPVLELPTVRDPQPALLPVAGSAAADHGDTHAPRQPRLDLGLLALAMLLGALHQGIVAQRFAGFRATPAHSTLPKPETTRGSHSCRSASATAQSAPSTMFRS